MVPVQVILVVTLVELVLKHVFLSFVLVLQVLAAHVVLHVWEHVLKIHVEIPAEAHVAKPVKRVLKHVFLRFVLVLQVPAELV